MENSYEKLCIEKNTLFSVHYGKGMYYTNDNATALHYDTAFTITYFKHCSGMIKIEGKCYNINDGDAVLMNTEEIHCCTVDNGTYHERISLFISDIFLKTFPFDCDNLLDCFRKRASGINNLVHKEEIGTLFNDILKFAREKNKVLCMCKITELLWILNSYSFSSDENVTSENTSLTDKILLYINKNFTQELTCENIAKHFYLSKFRIQHLFKNAVGVSLWDYVILRRLIYCNELLKNHYTVKSAAQLSGFNNYSNFYRLYKKHMKITPYEYKKSFEHKKP